jgi:hypothetical protein
MLREIFRYIETHTEICKHVFIDTYINRYTCTRIHDINMYTFLFIYMYAYRDHIYTYIYIYIPSTW